MVKINWTNSGREKCCDTKTFIKTYMPEIPTGGDVKVTVFTCDIAFEISCNGIYLGSWMYEFFTS